MKLCWTWTSPHEIVGSNKVLLLRQRPGLKFLGQPTGSKPDFFLLSSFYQDLRSIFETILEYKLSLVPAEARLFAAVPSSL